MAKLLEQINPLPDDIKNIIFEMLPNSEKIFLNKKYYEKYHYLIRQMIINNKNFLSAATYGMEAYIRNIVRNNYYFSFDRIVKENFDRWLFMKKYRYKDIVFSNYVRFLIYYCNEFESYDCLNRLITNERYVKLFGIFKKEHKNIVYTSIKWTN